MTLDEVDLDVVLDEIWDAVALDDRKPGEVTVREFAERFGLSLGQARGRLERALGRGKVEKRKCAIGDKWVCVYRVK